MILQYHNTFDGRFSCFVLTSSGGVTNTEGGVTILDWITDKISSRSSFSRCPIKSSTVACSLQPQEVSSSLGGLGYVSYIATSVPVMPIKPG